jgi:hypothetical protein
VRGLRSYLSQFQYPGGVKSFRGIFEIGLLISGEIKVKNKCERDFWAVGFPLLRDVRGWSLAKKFNRNMAGTSGLGLVWQLNQGYFSFLIRRDFLEPDLEGHLHGTGVSRQVTA